MASELERIVTQARATYQRLAARHISERKGSLLAMGSTPLSGDRETDLAMQWSDGWLLLAIYLAQGEGVAVELADIIGAGDAINHAIFTDAELDGGFLWLQWAGWIAIEGPRCTVTEQFASQWRAAAVQEVGPLLDRLGAVCSIINAPPWTPAG